MELGITFVPLESLKRESFKNRTVILSLHGIADNFARIEGRTGAGFVIENRAVKLLLGSKVAKDHRFRDACRLRDLFGCSAAKTSLRKEADSQAENLHAPFVACHTRRDRARGNIVGGGDLFVQTRLESISLGR